MDENPYQSPQSEAEATNSDDNRDHLKSIARSQRWVILAAVVNLVGAIDPGAAVLDPRIAVVVIASLLSSMAAAFLLGRCLHGIGGGLIWAFICGISWISLVGLMLLNHLATSRLESSGVRVGLLGASQDSV